METSKELAFQSSVLSHQRGDVPVKKRRTTVTASGSLKPRTSSEKTTLSNKAQNLKSVNTINDLPTSGGHSPINETSQRSSSGESQKSGSSSYNVQNVRQANSQTSRLRSPNNAHSPVSPSGRTPPLPYTENFSRPRKASVKANDDLVRPSFHPPSPSPHSNRHDIPIRDRGLSLSSSKSAKISRLAPLRPNTATSEPSFDLPMSRNRKVTGNSTYSNPSEIQVLPRQYREHREPLPRPDDVDEEAVRASFRSALTASSSIIRNSSTERSSFMTKSSPATSLYERDEGMSVEDAIGMYEAGFNDSDVEDPISRPGSSQSCHSGQDVLPLPRSDSLLPPSFPNLIVRDSTDIFRGPQLSESLCNSPHPDSNGTPTPMQVPARFQALTKGKTGISNPLNEMRTPLSPESTLDRYGFKKQTPHISLDDYDAWDEQYIKHLERRRLKWVSLMTDAGFISDNPTSFPSKSTKIKRFIRKGIPPDWRGAAWFWYAGGPAIIAKNAGVYERLVLRAGQGDVDSTDEELIERDLHRTFPDNIKFKPNAVAPARQEDFELETPILKSLRKVLQAFSIHNPKIGYCQSLNFIAGLLLLFIDEEKAFWLLNIITTEYLPGTHEVNLEGANVDLGVLMTSIKEAMPAIWTKIANELDGTVATGGEGKIPMRLPPISLCCTAWFMSCFIGTLPIESTLRVWDSFFYEGSKTFFRISLAIFKVGEAEIRGVNDPMEVFQVVQTIPRRMIDANALMEACFKRRNGFGHLSQETIEARRLERRAAYLEERAKATGSTAPAGTKRKNTVFTRKKAKTIENGANMGLLKTRPTFPL